MATFARKKLAFVQLSATPGTTVYDPASSTIGLIHNMVIYNSGSVDSQLVIISMHDGTHEYILFKFTVTALDTVLIDFKGEGLVVDAASKITGSTTTGSVVTCLLTGSEEVA